MIQICLFSNLLKWLQRYNIYVFFRVCDDNDNERYQSCCWYHVTVTIGRQMFSLSIVAQNRSLPLTAADCEST